MNMGYLDAKTVSSSLMEGEIVTDMFVELYWNSSSYLIILVICEI